MNVTTINHRNLDEWLFEHLEGTLSPAETASLQDYLAAHPELKPEVEVWENSFIKEPEMAWPGEAAFLESKGLTGSYWTRWKIGLNVLLAGLAIGAVLYFTAASTSEPQQVSSIEEAPLNSPGNTNPELAALLEEEMNLAIPTGFDQDVEWNVGLPDDQRMKDYIQKEEKEFSVADSKNAGKTSLKPASPSLQKDTEPVQKGVTEPDQEGPGSNTNFMTQLNIVASEVSDQDLPDDKADPKTVEAKQYLKQEPEAKKGNLTMPFTMDRPGIPKEKIDLAKPESRKTKRDKRRGNKGNFVPIHSDPF